MFDSFLMPQCEEVYNSEEMFERWEQEVQEIFEKEDKDIEYTYE